MAEESSSSAKSYHHRSFSSYSSSTENSLYLDAETSATKTDIATSSSGDIDRNSTTPIVQEPMDLKELTNQGHLINAAKVTKNNRISALASKFFDEKVPLKKRLRWLKRASMVKDDGTVEFEVPGDIKPHSPDFRTGVTGNDVQDEESDEATLVHNIRPLQIAMLIVGTRGDVQPFVAIAKRLQVFQIPVFFSITFYAMIISFRKICCVFLFSCAYDYDFLCIRIIEFVDY
ncbi:putative sterol 3-beta-glucosyltransferase [Lupinus albus]|uniref:Putative sterol 3-beta-glucosyltransferase n=1 Tax=Lupinus albus TaxID=3870 RepID=A0A6A4NWL9_LUPAL|nr:putative sterol 3-beta-glucosyltransferase [Lupinus albus]